MLMDRKGTNLAAQVEFESFNRQLNAVNRHTSSKLVNAVQQDVHAMLQQAESPWKRRRARLSNRRSKRRTTS